MAYKISGTKSETARIMVLKESDWSIESNTVISGSGAYEITTLEAGAKTVLAETTEGEVIAFGDVDALYFYNAGDRGVFGGGDGGNVYNLMEYITISSLSNTTNFGDLDAMNRHAACASSARGVFAGGYSPSWAQATLINYITISTPSNASIFGDLTVGRIELAACSNETRGIFAGGRSGYFNELDYITISTLNDAQDFADLSVARSGLAGCASPTRGVFGGGNTGSVNDTIDYITISTPGGTATDFGDLTVARQFVAACSNSTRGVFGGGTTGSFSNIIDYITIATPGGTATDFGDLTEEKIGLTACSNSAGRGVFAGGYNTGAANVNVIEYITISIPGGTANDFGDLDYSRRYIAACSDGHGGLT